MNAKFYIVGEEDFADFNEYADFRDWGRKFRRGQWNELKEGAAGQ